MDGAQKIKELFRRHNLEVTVFSFHLSYNLHKFTKKLTEKD